MKEEVERFGLGGRTESEMMKGTVEVVRVPERSRTEPVVTEFVVWAEGVGVGM